MVNTAKVLWSQKLIFKPESGSRSQSRFGTEQEVVIRRHHISTRKMVGLIEAHDGCWWTVFLAFRVKFVPLGKADTNLISTETAGGFTGIYLGLFSTGNGSQCNTPAAFDWFEYKGI